MCCEKEKEDKEPKSILLDLLPVAYPLESRKQETVFKLIGASKTIHSQSLKRAKKFEQVPGALPDPDEEVFRLKFLEQVEQVPKELPKLGDEGVRPQDVRQMAINRISDLINKAIDYALSKKMESRQLSQVRWFRITGYLFQVQRSLLKEYDELRIGEKLDQLQVVIDELKAKNRENTKGS